MSTEITNNNNKEEKIEPKIDYKRISLAFVDSIFSQINPSMQEKDPLNSTVKEFYSREPKKNIQEELKTPLKQKNNSENPEIPKISENSEKKSNSGNKNKKNEKNATKSSTSTSTITKKNNYNNSYKQKKLLYNTSAKNIKKSNKPMNENNKNNNNKSKTRNLIKAKKIYFSINDNYKAKVESEKEKKLYQEKVRLLENRIFALKNHEDDIHRKMHYNDIRQTYLNQKKKEKNDMKQALLSYDIDKRNELDLKRKATRDQKCSLNKHLKESIEKSKITKIKNYENMQKEKKLALSIINANNNKLERYGKRNVKKIQKEREQIKRNELNKQKNMGKTADLYYLETCEDNKNETNKLKNKLKMLEKLEIKYMNSLNKTRQNMMRHNSEGLYFYKKDIAPITKLDLDKQINNMTIYKRNHNKTTSVDNFNKHYKVDENENENDTNKKEKTNSKKE